MIVKDCNGYLKPQQTVMNIISQVYSSGTFSYQDVIMALRSLGVKVNEEYIIKDGKRQITVKQVRAALNRNSFRKDEIPAHVWSEHLLMKLGHGWYTWGSKIKS